MLPPCPPSSFEWFKALADIACGKKRWIFPLCNLLPKVRESFWVCLQARSKKRFALIGPALMDEELNFWHAISLRFCSCSTRDSFVCFYAGNSVAWLMEPCHAFWVNQQKFMRWREIHFFGGKIGFFRFLLHRHTIPNFSEIFPRIDKEDN